MMAMHQLNSDSDDHHLLPTPILSGPDLAHVFKKLAAVYLRYLQLGFIVLSAST